jgi:hypothetical protein
MATHVERAVDALFPHQGGRIRNVKYHHGWCPTVTAEQLAEQLLAADSQIAAGTATRITDVDGNLDD